MSNRALLYIVLVLALGGLMAAAADGECSAFGSSCSQCTNASEGCRWCPESNSCLPVLSACPSGELPFIIEQQCRCATGVLSDCSACVKRPGCVFINEGTLRVSVGETSVSQVLASNGQCWTGTPFSVTNSHNSIVIHSRVLQIDLSATDWCWGQCSIKRSWGFVVIALAILVGIAILSYLAVRWRRLRRRHSSSKENASLSMSF